MRTPLLSLVLGLVATAQLSAQPYTGTIFIDPDIITEDDPGTLVSVTYTGQSMETMWDYRVTAWVTVNAYLFDVVWSDGLTTEAQVNPEFGSEAAAQVEVQKYAEALGRIPTCLRTDVDELWMHAGVYSFGGGNNAIVIHTGRGEEYIADGILEEAFVHEGTHCSLDAAHASAPGWLSAQAADPSFISTYAQTNPTTEDLSESFLPWMAVRYRSARISTADVDAISAAIPNRMAYLDAMPCDLFPITADVGIVEAGSTFTLGVYPSPASTTLNLRADRPLPSNTILELLTTDGRVAQHTALNSTAPVDISQLAPGLYLWRCIASSAVLARGSVVVE